ncbi:MAG: anti-sigma factor [Alphaproteobacteria bacterium]|nr:anti-sigma factor [Alphaproteobacteria bacterium]
MQKHSDEALVAYLDGELDAAERAHVEAWLDAEPAARDRLLALSDQAGLLRAAFDEVSSEPVPERLIAAARGEIAPLRGDGEVVVLRPRRSAAPVETRRWYVQMAAAAGLFGLAVGVGAGYLGGHTLAPAVPPADRQTETVATNTWLDNAAADYRLVVNAGADSMLDVPAGGEGNDALQKISQNLPQQQVRLPDLKPWGLTFRGARLVVVDGRPGAQLVYGTDNKAIGPLALIIGSTKQPDLAPTPGRRDDVNLLYWRHQGRASVLVGQGNIGYLWGIANDVAWQLDAI